MITENVKLIKKNIVPERAMEHMRHITQHHRAQISQGYRDAAIYCMEALKSRGVDSKILSYTANASTRYLEDVMFPEWICKKGHLELVEPYNQVLCDYEADNMSIILRSVSKNFMETGLEVMHLNKGSKEEDYKDVDLSGKMILVDDHQSSYMKWAVEKKGALGILSDFMPEHDGMRSKYEMADSRIYKAFPAINETTAKTFGFSLTLREGEMLRALCKKMEAENAKDSTKPRYPVVKGCIESEFHDGFLDNVIAEIQGETDEFVLLTAHLCHPKPSANDNASGCAGSMELMTTLNELISSNKLKKPKMGIRMLLIPEMTGTNAYLASLDEESRKKIKAGINLDMIGGIQGKNAGPVNIFRTPDSAASFINELTEMVLDEVKKDSKVIFLPDEYISLYQFEIHKFCGGSDHQILNDPSVGIPTLSFTQWPDKFYHTNFDTVERIDPQLIARSAAIAGGVLYTLATLNKEDLLQILIKISEIYDRQLSQETINWMQYKGNIEDLERKLRYIKRNTICAIKDFSRFIEIDDSIGIILSKEEEYYDLLFNKTIQRCTMMINTKLNPKEQIALDDKYKTVYKKLYIGGYNYSEVSDFIKSNEDKYKKYTELSSKYGRADSYIRYWINGKHSIEQTYENSFMECGVGDLEYTYEFLSLLMDKGLLEQVN